MLRFRVMVSAVPLLVLGLVARTELGGPQPPCIAVGDLAVRIAPAFAQAQLNVGFTADPARASVRIQIVDEPEAADLAIIDDVGGREDDACRLTSRTRLVAIASRPPASDPMIYLSRNDGADFRIFVRSARLTLREAAALVVAASDRPAPITTASIGGGS